MCVLEQGRAILLETLETGQVTEVIDLLEDFFQVARFIRGDIDLDRVRLSVFGISANVKANGIVLLGLEDQNQQHGEVHYASFDE
jgi:hypothetical protein